MTLWLNYPDTYNKIGFTGRLHLWWPLLLCRAIANGFHLPHTRLAFKHLRPLSCQRLRPIATLTTWISLLYVRLTDPLEFWDVILTWILTLIIYTIHYHEISSRDSWNYVYLTPNSCSSCHNHHFYLKHPILMSKHH